MLKQILGIPISLKASRIFKKIISSALLFFVLGSVFLSTGLQAFADEFVNISVSGAIYSYQITNSGVNGSINVGTDNYVSYIDYTLTVGDQFTVGTHPEDGRCYGYYQSRDNFTLSLGISSNTNTVTKNVEYLGFTPLEADYDYTDLSSYTISSGGSNNFANITFTRNTIRYINDRTIRSGPNYVSGSYKFRVYFVSSEGKLGLLGSAGATRTAGLGYTASMKYVPSGSDYLYSIDQQQSITNNLLNIDNSGVSNNVNSAASIAAIDEANADSAISSALPSAGAELNSISAYDYNSIHTDNATAFSFWKSLGDYILSNSNLRGIGALLILCLFLGFVVFLLRL